MYYGAERPVFNDLATVHPTRFSRLLRLVLAAGCLLGWVPDSRHSQSTNSSNDRFLAPCLNWCSRPEAVI